MSKKILYIPTKISYLHILEHFSYFNILQAINVERLSTHDLKQIKSQQPIYIQNQYSKSSKYIQSSHGQKFVVYVLQLKCSHIPLLHLHFKTQNLDRHLSSIPNIANYKRVRIFGIFFKKKKRE